MTMQSAHPNVESATEWLKFGTALLAFLTAALGAGYGIYKIRQERKSLLQSVNLLQTSWTVLSIAGTIAIWVFNANRLGVALFVLMSILISVDYVRGAVPTKRGETLALVLSWSSSVLLMAMEMVTRIFALLGHIVGLLDRLVNRIAP